MRHKIFLVLFLTLFVLVIVQSKRLGKSRGSSSSRGSRTNYKPVPTSLSYPQPPPKPSSTGWQQKPVQQQQTAGSHAYPSSQTGLSGNNAPKQPPKYQEAVQKSHSYPQSSGTSGISNQQPHSQQSNIAYPASNGLSGTGTAGQGVSGISNQQSRNQQPSHSYPANNGLSGAGTGSGYPSQQGVGMSGAASNTNHQGSHGMYPQNNMGSNYHGHNQGPPQPYPGNSGPGYGGYGNNAGYGAGSAPQMPGYYGNYMNNGRGFGGASRSSSALMGLGVAGAGVGTILTGLALWNLARATGRQHHTVVYDNRGQPVAVQPANNSDSAMDSWLADLVNCSLTITNTNSTEILAIPCAIATSFSPEANVKEAGINNNNTEDTTKCTVSVLTKSGKEYMTTIPCSILLTTAAENNVTEAPLPVHDMTTFHNNTDKAPDQNIYIEPTLFNNNMTEFQNTTETASVQNNFNESQAVHPQMADHIAQSPECVKDESNSCLAVNQNVSFIPSALYNNNTELVTPVVA